MSGERIIEGLKEAIDYTVSANSGATDRGEQAPGEWEVHRTVSTYGDVYSVGRLIGPNDYDCVINTMNRERAEFFANAANAYERENDLIRKLVGVLESVRPYVDEQIRRDGGLDSCEIGLRMDLEAIDDALSIARRRILQQEQGLLANPDDATATALSI